MEENIQTFRLFLIFATILSFLLSGTSIWILIALLNVNIIVVVDGADVDDDPESDKNVSNRCDKEAISDEGTGRRAVFWEEVDADEDDGDEVDYEEEDVDLEEDGVEVLIIKYEISVEALNKEINPNKNS